MELAITVQKDEVILPLQYSEYADVFSEQTLTLYPHNETLITPLTSRNLLH